MYDNYLNKKYFGSIFYTVPCTPLLIFEGIILQNTHFIILMLIFLFSRHEIEPKIRLSLPVLQNLTTMWTFIQKRKSGKMCTPNFY